MTPRDSEDVSDAIAGSSIYWSTAPALLLSSQLSTMRLPSPEELRNRLIGVLDRFVSSARDAGMPDVDIAEARYALVAFMDEQILKSDWVGRTEWMNQPLQLMLYKEYTAGENFFMRMRALLEARDRIHALEVYYLCLAMGFRGASNARGEAGSPSQFIDTAKERLASFFKPSHELSPHARPLDRARAQRQRVWPVVVWVMGCLLVAVSVWGGLRWSIRRAVDDAVKLAPSTEPTAR
ncbi:MAG TPA: DotU family type IV/VI secretion system protein [Polyangiaceae bacterium]|jgi:type VI secretion system protein ImpK|nr:DotU family type IV/VI secretion system protein [Polyangiaceae bacterium]